MLVFANFEPLIPSPATIVYTTKWPPKWPFSPFSKLKSRGPKMTKKHDFHDFSLFKTHRSGHNIRFLTPCFLLFDICSKVFKTLFLGVYGVVRGVLNTSFGHFSSAVELLSTAVAKKWSFWTPFPYWLWLERSQICEDGKMQKMTKNARFSTKMTHFRLKCPIWPKLTKNDPFCLNLKYTLLKVLLF